MVNDACTAGKFTADKKSHFIELGKKVGAESLRLTLDSMATVVKPTDIIHGETGMRLAGMQEWKKLSDVPADKLMELRDADKATYMKLYKAELMGLVLASALGVLPAMGAVTAVGGTMIFGGFMPKGVAMDGVLTEVWTGELIKALRAGDKATFLDGLPDYSQYAENDVIHMVDVGGDPDVLVNNTTYPISVQQITDTDAVFSLDKFQTKPTSITDDELYALSYDKMASVKERHAQALLVKKYAKAIHALAPDGNAAKTPVLKTTGELEGGGATGRRMLQRSDIIALSGIRVRE